MKRKVMAMVMAAAMAMSMAACGGDDKKEDTGKTENTAEPEKEEGKEDASGEEYVIGYAPATLNNAFWLAVKDGVEQAIEESGANVKLVDIDANGDQSVMNDGISNLISSGIDALLCAPADSTAVASALTELKDAGVPVINFDTPVEDPNMVETIIASDNTNAGYVVGKDVGEKIEDGAKILVLDSPRASACVQRYDGFIKALDESGKKYEIVNVLDGEGDQETYLGLVSDALVADPDLSVIFAVNDPSAMGAVNAIQQANVALENEIMVYGVDGNPDAKKMIKAGTMEGTGSQSPETLGYESMMSALDVLAGKEIEKEIVVDTFLITADNVEEYGTDGWQ